MAEAGEEVVAVKTAGTPPPRPAEVWKTGLVACYHPFDKRIDMGMGWEKCGVCLYFRQADGQDYWPPSTQ